MMQSSEEQKGKINHENNCSGSGVIASGRSKFLKARCSGELRMEIIGRTNKTIDKGQGTEKMQAFSLHVSTPRIQGRFGTERKIQGPGR